MTTTPFLSVDHLTLALNGKNQTRSLVRDVSLALAPRQILGLIGESGSGKSLTCLAIMDLLPAGIRKISGSIHMAGDQLERLKPNVLRGIRGSRAAMILQNPMSCFDTVFTIHHHFRETLASHDAHRARNHLTEARQALGQVGFDHPDEILGLYPFQMSGGMLQRVMVALALMMGVSLLIADEPTTDLDVVSQSRILDLLERLRTTHGMAMLLVTHDLSVIARLADHVAVMKEGAVVETGPLERIFNDSRHPYTQGLLKAHLSLYSRRLERLQTAAGRQILQDSRAAAN
jgi:nickel transport system ATP-binding protein